MRRTQFTEDHDLFRDSFRTFVEREMVPHHIVWNEQGVVPRELFATAGAAGFLGMAVPEELGGGGVDDFRYNQVISEELQYAGVAAAGLGLTLHSDICLPYFLSLATDEQRSRWLPGIASGEMITAIAMTEPGIGSDLASMSTSAVRDGDHYVVNGAKTFITNGIQADLVVVACKTDPEAGHRGISLIVVEGGAEGFARGRKLDKVGLKSQDTAELFFDDVRVPAENLIGEEGRGFHHMMGNLPTERLAIAVSSLAGAERAFALTLEYAKTRTAFGKPIGQFQANRFALADIRAKLDVARGYLDGCIMALVEERLSAEEAAAAKYWTTENAWQIIDRCMQLYGGYGYVNEYEIARLWRDNRIHRVFGGTSEIMQEIIGRSLGL
jgi:alkylation response protein AidB-like acyl-CoA dehydrogenase